MTLTEDVHNIKPAVELNYSFTDDPEYRKKVPYSGKVWRGESLANLANHRRFAKLKPSKLIPTIDDPLADPFIRQTFFRQTLKNSRFAKHYARQTFPLYGMYVCTTTSTLLEINKINKKEK